LTLPRCSALRLFLSATLPLCVSLYSSVFSALKIFLPPFFCLPFGSFLLVAARPRCVSVSAFLTSPNFDSRLTLSIPCIALPLKGFHCRALEHSDTLSVY